MLSRAERRWAARSGAYPSPTESGTGAAVANKEDVAFGMVLLEYRTAAGLTQVQLAERAGLSPDAISALESGKRRSPRVSTIEQIATALELSAQERHKFVTAARGMGKTGATAPSNTTSGVSDGPTRDAVPDARGRLRSWAARFDPTPLVGRLDELDIILHRLQVEHVRLLTLTGPAGVGKTRLALAAAARLSATERFPDGITLVDLTAVRDPALVLSTIAQALGLLDIGSRPLLERVTDALEGREYLLVLDNFEQVLPAAAQLAELLVACPSLALLVTSRVPLQLRWEQTLRIAPLPVPDLREALPQLDMLLAIPSVALFVDRAQARRADFALTGAQARLVAQVAAQLDGLPLALELAAARLDMLSLPTLARHLGDRLRLLASEAPDRPERQQSLEAAVGWSYDLLTEPERRLFRCLGVFVGRVTLDAIAAVVAAVTRVSSVVSVGSTVSTVGAEGVAVGAGDVRDAGRTLHRLLSLAEKSLLLPVSRRSTELGELTGLSGEMGLAGVRPEAEAHDVADELDLEPAFGMLETVREYAQERLAEAGELAAARRAHAHYFLALAERADPLLRGPDQSAWFFRLEREHDNLRAALRWLLDGSDRDRPDAAAEREAGLRLAGALGWFWLLRGYQTEGRRWMEEGLARAPAGKGADLAVRTRALLAAGPLLAVQTEFARARAVLEEGLALAQQRQEATDIAHALTYLGLLAVVHGDMAAALRSLAEARVRWEDLGERFFLGLTLNLLGAVAFAQGDYVQAEALVAAALERMAAAGEKREAGITHVNYAVIAWQRGDPLRAASHLRVGLHTSVALQDRFLLAQSVRPILGLTGEHIDPEWQARLLGAADTLGQATGGTLNFYERLPGYPGVATVRARLEQERWETPYREGWSLPLVDIATLALTVVDEAAQLQMQSESVSKRATPQSEVLQEQPSQQSDWSPLTVREQEVLRLVAQGLSSKAIGQQLFLSPHTVNHHLTAIFNKLGVSTRAQAVSEAAKRGLM